MTKKYKTAFRSPQGAKISEATVTEMVEHVLEVLTNGGIPNCETCPLQYVFAGEEDIRYCWLIDNYVVYYNESWCEPKCELEHYKNYVLKLIKQSYGD